MLMIIVRSMCLLLALVSLLSCVANNGSVPSSPPTAAENIWFDNGRKVVDARSALKPNTHRAKNVILFVADGMGISTITTARIFDGQSRGQNGEENSLAFETFPQVALVKTYNTDAQTPDSAGTASAMNTGVKTRIGVINTWADQYNCYGPEAISEVTFPLTLAERVEQRGMATGVVSTARITHATPAAVYGHSPSRDWESDQDIPAVERAKGCKDLADQLVNFPYGDGIDLILGGGKRAFLPQSNGGVRADQRNLLQEWQAKKASHIVLENVGELRSSKVLGSKVLGLFTPSHMAYEVDRKEAEEPSLAEMTRFAIDHLAPNPQGYFLMVEGARIDHAHHNTNAYRALADTQAFAEAVKAAVAHVNLDDTLILVTADHSHVFTMGGYSQRGNPILGLVRSHSDQGSALVNADDGKPYTTLGYHNGPHVRSNTDAVLTHEQVQHPDFKQQVGVFRKSETHGGEDVALFATGASSYLVGGVIEQNVIFHIMAKALGL